MSDPQPPPNAVPAGWYPDPSAPPHAPAQRYWDGGRWTEHVAAGRARPVVPVGPTTPDGVPLGDPGMRVVAYLVDSLVASAISAVVGLPFLIASGRAYAEWIEQLAPTPGSQVGTDQPLDLRTDLLGGMVGPYAGYLAVSVVVLIAYHVAMLATRSRTLGLQATGLEVRLRDRPGPIGWGVALRRAVAQFLPAMVPVVGTIWLIVDCVAATRGEDRQTLHDRFAGTSVVRAPAKS